MIVIIFKSKGLVKEIKRQTNINEVLEGLQNLKLKDYNDDSSSNRVIYFGDRYYNQSSKSSRNVSLFDLALMLLNAGFELK